MPSSKSGPPFNEDWFMACKHSKHQERVTLQVRDIVDNAEKPKHENDFVFGKKYVVSTVTKTFDETRKSLVHVRKKYKVYIGRIAATREKLQASIEKSRLRFPTANPRDSDSQGTESELEKTILSPRENPSFLDKLKRNAAQSDMSDMSDFVGDSLLRTSKKSKLSSSYSSQTNQHSVLPSGIANSNGSLPCDLNSTSSPVASKAALTGGSPFATPKSTFKARRIINPQSAKAKVSVKSNSQSVILSSPSSSLVSATPSSCSNASSFVASVCKMTESGFCDGLISSDSTDLNSLFVVTNSAGEPISTSNMLADNSFNFKVPEVGSLGDTSVVSAAVDFSDVDPQLQIQYWKEKYLKASGDTKASQDIIALQDTKASQDAAPSAVLSQLKNITATLSDIRSRLTAIESIDISGISSRLAAIESKEPRKLNCSQRRVARWLVDCEFDQNASYSCNSSNSSHSSYPH